MAASIFAGTLAELTWPEVEAAAARDAAVLVPVGVIEQHGPHLPLATDVYGAHCLCTLVRDRMGERGVVAPPFYWGVNHVSSAFPGSFRTRPEVAAALLEDIIESLVTDGFERILLVNHHGDRAHNEMLLGTVQGARQRGREGVRFVETVELVQRLGSDPHDPAWLIYALPPEAAQIKLSGVLGIHAHEVETALVEHWHPELVRAEELARLKPTDLDEDDLEQWRRGGRHARAVTPDGYFGAPRPVDTDVWRLYELRARGIAEAIEADSRRR